MKNIILTILRTGFTTTKKYTAQDLIKKFYPLKHLIKENDGLITCNGNAFWQVDNNGNRAELIRDIKNCDRLGNIKSDFSIINRFENGDKYGIITGA